METRVTIEELMRLVMQGERNLNCIAPPPHSDLSNHPDYPHFQSYLIHHLRKENPITLHQAQLQGLTAKGLYLPYAIATEANLWQADLEGAILQEADLTHANLAGACLRKTIV
ncbi:pentapeptide repeat-containing protein [Candidatus Woesearchaeota archaeon]|nr:pentapeptide repeat-containing protein [Candidatus Woesearchaeota archaeon]